MLLADDAGELRQRVVVLRVGIARMLVMRGLRLGLKAPLESVQIDGGALPGHGLAHYTNLVPRR